MSYKEKTLKAYNSSLLKIRLCGFDPDNLDVDKFIEYLNKNNIPIRSQNLYVSALQWYNSETKKDIELSNKLAKETTKIRTLINKEYDQNELSEREKKNFIEWEIILKIYDYVKDKAIQFNDKRTQNDYLLLSLYVLHPPRRCDYQNMYISDMDITLYKNRIINTNSKYSGEWFSLDKFTKHERINNDIKNKTNKNYYILNNGKGHFCFDEYKTFNFYGKQIIEVKSDLDTIIKEHIKKNNLKVGDKLLDLTYANYAKRLSLLFECYVNRKPSVDILRHSFINYVIRQYQNKNGNDGANMEKRKEISLLMGHSISTQLLYFKFYNTNDQMEINPNNDKCKKTYQKIENEEEKLKKRIADKKEWYEKNKKQILQKRKEQRDKLIKS